jgi:hypothetical protein
MYGIIFSYMRYLSLASDTIYPEVMMDVVSGFQATIIYFPAANMIQPLHDLPEGGH